MTTAILDKPLTRYRTAPATGANPKADRAGGMYGAGLITGAAAITRGEALGHREWVDSFAVDQVIELGNRSPKGIKVRFTHPGLSADGMGTQLGRMKNFRRDGDRAIGDIHFSRASHKTPDGDLATYVMDMADEDAEAFGMSIVFSSDDKLEREFREGNKDADGNFKSPDDGNSRNYPHIRLGKLWASDVVDDPAANPAGLFRAGHEIADEADRLCEFALGLTTERPALQHLSVDAERLAQYAARFLNSHNLELKEKEMTATNTAPAGITSEQLSAQLNAFGATLLGQVDERIKAALKPQEAPAPTAAELEAKGGERFEKLTALAKSAGLKEYEKIGKDWFSKGLSVEDAEAAVKPLMVNQNPLTNDKGEDPADPLAKYKAEYAKGRAHFAAMNLSEAEYIESRMVDDGAAVLAAGAGVAA